MGHRRAPDRQGAVDGHLLYEDGHRGALEITTIGSRQAQEMEKLLGKANFTWRSDDLQWWWTVEIHKWLDLRRYRSELPPLLRDFEANGTRHVEYVRGAFARREIGRQLNAGILPHLDIQT